MIPAGRKRGWARIALAAAVGLVLFLGVLAVGVGTAAGGTTADGAPTQDAQQSGSCVGGEDARLTVRSTDDDDQFVYAILVDGTAEAIRTGPDSADDETVEENADGTVSIVGSTGSGAGDAFRISGRVVHAWTFGSAGHRIELDDRDVTDAVAFPGSSEPCLSADGARLSVLPTAAQGEGEFSYRIVVDGDAEPITAGGNSADDEDTVTRDGDRTVITGSTGSGAGDAFRVDGRVVSGTTTGSDAYRIELDGRDVTEAVVNDAGSGGVGDVGGSGGAGSVSTEPGTDGATGTEDGAGDGTGSGDDAATVRTLANCTVVDSPGRYELAGDISGSPVTVERGEPPVCIAVTSGDVVLDGGGNTVAGGGRDGVGVRVLAPDADRELSNVTVGNVRVTGWETGVAFGEIGRGPTAELRDVTATGNAGPGVALRGGDGMTVRNVTARDNGVGVTLFEVTEVDARSVVVRGNAEGGLQLLQDVTGSTFVDVRARGNGGTGVYTSDGVTGNELRDVVAVANGEDGVGAADSSDNVVRDLVTARNDEAGIHVYGTGSGTFVNATARDQLHGILLDGSVTATLRGGTVRDNDGAAVLVNAADRVELSGVEVANNSGHGVYLDNEQGEARLRRVEIADNVGDGIVASADGATVVDSVVADNGGYGVGVSRETTLRNVTVTGNQRLALASFEAGTTAEQLRIGESVVVAMEYEELELGPVAPDAVPPLPPGATAVGPGLRVDAIEADFDARFAVDTDAADGEVQLWRRDGASWTVVDDGRAATENTVGGPITVSDAEPILVPVSVTDTPSNGDGGTDDTGGADAVVTADGERLSVLSTDEDSEFGYRIVVEGDADPIAEGANSADDGDTVTREGDRAIITGSTGSGAGDAFRVTGRIVDVSVSGSDAYRIELGDRDVTDALTG